jgi:predicted ArsR family transcriptional regulator
MAVTRLVRGDWVNVIEVATELGISRKAARQRLDRLHAAGVLERRRLGGGHLQWRERERMRAGRWRP